ncbi:ANTAR domain-containing protein [Streptomyces sp. NPDC058335]|uniref:ANTAR domain-containing protein n=1 Tax=Streptomyces sp. NPDC058335 TaxID=3346451 RepID=UPI003666786C
MMSDQPCRAGESPAPLMMKASPLDGESLGQVTFLQVRGTLDASNADDFSHALASHLAHAEVTETHAVLDMTDVHLSSAAAVRALDQVTRGLAAAGRPLPIVQPRPHVREALRLAGLPGIRPHATVEAALEGLRATPDPSQVTAPADPAPPLPVGDLHAEVRGLRAKLRSSALIGVAQGVLVERYGLPTAAVAFDLLSGASQHCNVPVRVLASAVVTTPPAGRAPAWSDHPPVPTAPFLRHADVSPVERRRVLDAAAREALAVTGARSVDLLCAEEAQDTLVLEARCNLGEAFADEFAEVSRVRAPCTVAHTTLSRVVVESVATDPVFAGARMREVLLAEGTRSLYCAPLVGGAGTSVGVVSAHWPAAGRWLSGPQERALDALARDVATWHEWYRRSVVADALDHLHRSARS